jgi:hypothetical protein
LVEFDDFSILDKVSTFGGWVEDSDGGTSLGVSRPQVEDLILGW